MNRSLIFYTLLITIFSFLLWFVFNQGLRLETLPFSQSNAENASADAVNNQNVLALFSRNLSQNLGHPLSLLLLQIVTIVFVAKLLALLVSKIGQPLVIGEIIAGILLGPSLLGHFWPGLGSFLFQPQSLSNLQFLSQLGLILFMFIIGLELDIKVLKHKAHTAVVVSHASIIIPFLGGVSLAYFLYKIYAPPQISFLAFGLFMGIAMSITAFPVLARIIHERNLTHSPLGVLAITCAAADDITAWCILVVVIAIIQAGSATSALFTIILSAAYVLVMFKLVQPLLQRLGERYASGETISRSFSVAVFVVLFLSALGTEVIGIHALFGAFLAGVIMPNRAGFRKTLAAKIEDFSLVILLPLFFAFTGLKTQIGLLNNGTAWVVCGLIILVAVLGKAGGSVLAARITGQPWPDSLAIGALMNTRGLMELVVLSIGYDLGVLSPTIFTMMVLMALVTTFMTSPALSAIQRISWKKGLIRMDAVAEKL